MGQLGWRCSEAKVQVHLAARSAGIPPGFICVAWGLRERGCSLEYSWNWGLRATAGNPGETMQFQQTRRQWWWWMGRRGGPSGSGWVKGKGWGKTLGGPCGRGGLPSSAKEAESGKGQAMCQTQERPRLWDCGGERQRPRLATGCSFHCLGGLSSLGESSYSESLYNSSQSFQDLIMW